MLIRALAELMTGARTEFSFNDKALRRGLQQELRRLENPGPFLASIGEELAGAGGSINMRFKTETSPDGGAWAPLATATVERRLKKYRNAPMTILRMRGHLAGSINYQVNGPMLSVGTGREVEDYAAIHQFGGEAGRGLKAVIPARPYLGFSDADWEMIEDEAAEYFWSHT